jgi:hypothetical protein
MTDFLNALYVVPEEDVARNALTVNLNTSTIRVKAAVFFLENVRNRMC